MMSMNLVLIVELLLLLVQYSLYYCVVGASLSGLLAIV